jgi:hypothetical protein
MNCVVVLSYHAHIHVFSTARMKFVPRASEMLEHVAHDLLLDARIRHAHAAITPFVVIIVACVIIFVTRRQVVLFFIGF